MRITDLPVLYTASLEDVLYIIDTSDTTDFLSGSSKQITLSNFFTSSGIFGGTPSPSGPITGFKILSEKIISDGSTTVYTISSSLSDHSKDVFLFINGVNQTPDINYSLTSSVLTLFGSPLSGSEIEIRRFEISSSLFIGISTQKFISDGLTTDYTITSSASDTAKDVFLFINGVNQTPDINYSILNSNLTLFGAPFSGSEIEIRKFDLTSGGGTNLTTGSTYPITSSWAINVISSSYSTNPSTLNINSSGSTNTSTSASIMVLGQNTKGGTTYHDFLYVKNTYSASTNPQKTFRLNSVGDIEIINNTYNSVIFSLTDAGVLNTAGGGTSDIRKKQNVEYIINDVTPIINQFKPVVFEFIEHSGVKRYGFIAQDVLHIKPDLVLGDGDKKDGTYGLDYDGILALTVKSLQESNKKIKNLEETVNLLIQQINDLKSQ
jgi:hypothetical protein